MHKLALEYKFTEDGKPHAKVYKATAVVGEEDKGKGEGAKKKAAQTLAVSGRGAAQACLRARPISSAFACMGAMCAMPEKVWSLGADTSPLPSPLSPLPSPLSPNTRARQALDALTQLGVDLSSLASQGLMPRSLCMPVWRKRVAVGMYPRSSVCLWGCALGLRRR